MIKQIPLDLSPDPDFSLDRFVVGQGNKAAVKAILSWPHWSSPILLLCGGAGTGKTHLGRAWARDVGANILSFDDVAEVSEYHSNTAIFVDDADQADETALFSLMNLALNKQIAGLLLSSRQGPHSWNVSIPDLRSRLVNVPVLTLSDHADDILIPIVRKIFDDLGRYVPENLLAYLVKYESRSVDHMRRIAKALDHAARVERKDLTLGRAQKLLKTLR